MKVLWSDENKFIVLVRYSIGMFGIKKQRYIKGEAPHTHGEILRSRGNINSIMDSINYQAVLADNLPQGWDLAIGGLSTKTMTSKSIPKWFSDNTIDFLQWPSQALDLNPIQNLWAGLKRATQECDLSCKDLHRGMVQRLSLFSSSSFKLKHISPGRNVAVANKGANV